MSNEEQRKAQAMLKDFAKASDEKIGRQGTDLLLFQMAGFTAESHPDLWNMLSK